MDLKIYFLEIPRAHLQNSIRTFKFSRTSSASSLSISSSDDVPQLCNCCWVLNMDFPFINPQSNLMVLNRKFQVSSLYRHYVKLIDMVPEIVLTDFMSSSLSVENGIDLCVFTVTKICLKRRLNINITIIHNENVIWRHLTEKTTK